MMVTKLDLYYLQNITILGKYFQAKIRGIIQ